MAGIEPAQPQPQLPQQQQQQQLVDAAPATGGGIAAGGAAPHHPPTSPADLQQVQGVMQALVQARDAATLAAFLAGLRPAVLQREVAGFREQFAARAARLERERAQIFADHRRTLDNFGKLLESMSYQRVLERGYAVVRTLAGQPITRRAAAEPGMAVEIEFQDGRQQARLGSADTDPEPLARKPVSKPLPPGGKQGSLL